MIAKLVSVKRIQITARMNPHKELFAAIKKDEHERVRALVAEHPTILEDASRNGGACSDLCRRIAVVCMDKMEVICMRVAVIYRTVAVLLWELSVVHEVCVRARACGYLRCTGATKAVGYAVEKLVYGGSCCELIDRLSRRYGAHHLFRLWCACVCARARACAVRVRWGLARTHSGRFRCCCRLQPWKWLPRCAISALT
eukprot:COSAG02_NODE_245_length_27293_cov_16.488012_1_plen_199_part_00